MCSNCLTVKIVKIYTKCRKQRSNEQNMNELIKEAIENDDIYTASGELNDMYWHRYQESPKAGSAEEELKLIVDFIHSKLKIVADKFNINPEVPDEVEKIRHSYAKYVLLQKSGMDGNYSDQLKRLIDDSVIYIRRFLSNLEELKEVAENIDLKSPAELLIDKWKSLDLQSPIDTPCLVKKDNADEDWLDFGWEYNQENYRLETAEEVSERVSKINAERSKQLESCANIDNVAKFKEWWNFINIIPSLSNLYADIKESQSSETKKDADQLLQSFKNDENFYRQVNQIMAHDTENCIYWYHGTQCVEDAMSIARTGLVMASDDLEKTAYSEFSPDQLLKYSRGMLGEIGRDAVVIFKQPLVDDGNGNKVPKNIVIENEGGIGVNQSGLGGFIDRLDYFVPPEYIVGYINKRDHVVEWCNELTLD